MQAVIADRMIDIWLLTRPLTSKPLSSVQLVIYYRLFHWKVRCPLVSIPHQI